MKDSVNDILVTGDQSLTDIISCCKYKIVWYQIAPWKQGLAKKLSEQLPNKYFSTYKTSCGTIDSISLNINWKMFMSKYDFRKKGKKKINTIITANYHQNKKENKKLFKNLLEIIQKSRKISLVLKKFNDLYPPKKTKKKTKRKTNKAKSKSKSKSKSK